MRVPQVGPSRLTPFAIHLSALLVLAVVGAPQAAAGTYGCTMPDCPVGSGQGRLARTFEGPRGVLAGHAAARGGVAFEMTGDRFAELYAIGKELHVQFTSEEAVYDMHVGFGDLETPQTLRLPEMVYEETLVWVITDPALTPFGTDFPEATHALVSSEGLVGETIYKYFAFGSDALRFKGEVVVADGDPAPGISHGNSIMLGFPANSDVYLYDEYSVVFEGTEGVIWEEIAMHAFGTLEVDTATSFEMGAFFHDQFWHDPDDPDAGAIGTSEYSILGDDGSLVFFNIAANPTGGDTEIEGDVYIIDVEYVHLVDPEATAAEDGPVAGPSWSTYPNPAADVVRFSESLDVTLYDVLGRAVRSGEGVQSLDVSSLPAGLYVARTQAGESRPLVIR